MKQESFIIRISDIKMNNSTKHQINKICKQEVALYKKRKCQAEKSNQLQAMLLQNKQDIQKTAVKLNQQESKFNEIWAKLTEPEKVTALEIRAGYNLIDAT